MNRRKKSTIFDTLTEVLLFVLILWSIEVVNHLTGHHLNMLGLEPRRLSGLPGILFMPFLHGSFNHVLMNSVPLVILGTLISLRYHAMFWRISLIIVLIGGSAVWIFARPAIHIGASGLVFGYFGFLVAQGWYTRDLAGLIIAVAAIFLYGGMIWGIFPAQPYVSWEGHFFGLLAGIIAARLQLPGKRNTG